VAAKAGSGSASACASGGAAAARRPSRNRSRCRRAGAGSGPAPCALTHPSDGRQAGDQARFLRRPRQHRGPDARAPARGGTTVAAALRTAFHWRQGATFAAPTHPALAARTGVAARQARGRGHARSACRHTR
jgi:hypothetical protein